MASSLLRNAHAAMAAAMSAWLVCMAGVPAPSIGRGAWRERLARNAVHPGTSGIGAAGEDASCVPQKALDARLLQHRIGHRAHQ